MGDLRGVDELVVIIVLAVGINIVVFLDLDVRVDLHVLVVAVGAGVAEVVGGLGGGHDVIVVDAAEGHGPESGGDSRGGEGTDDEDGGGGDERGVDGVGKGFYERQSRRARMG